MQQNIKIQTLGSFILKISVDGKVLNKEEADEFWDNALEYMNTTQYQGEMLK